MNENKKHIEKILSKFLEFGIKSISMDDIAAELGISKKKLYQVYKDKTDIVTQSIEALKGYMQSTTKEFNDSTLNVIEKEIEHQNRYIETYLKIKPTFIYDLKKFYPDLFLSFGLFKRELLFESTHKFIEDGIEQGLFREDIDPVYIAKHTITVTAAYFHPDINEISDQDLASRHFYKQYFLYHLNGLCSEKGRQVLNKLMQKSKLNDN